MSAVRDDFTLEEMCAARDETRTRIVTHAITLIERVHALVAAIRAEVG